MVWVQGVIRVIALQGFGSDTKAKKVLSPAQEQCKTPYIRILASCPQLIESVSHGAVVRHFSPEGQGKCLTMVASSIHTPSPAW